MLATIRNRRGLIATVEPFDSPEGRLHLVRVEYTDSVTVVALSMMFCSGASSIACDRVYVANSS